MEKQDRLTSNTTLEKILHLLLELKRNIDKIAKIQSDLITRLSPLEANITKLEVNVSSLLASKSPADIFNQFGNIIPALEHNGSQPLQFSPDRLTLDFEKPTLYLHFSVVTTCGEFEKTSVLKLPVLSYQMPFALPPPEVMVYHVSAYFKANVTERKVVLLFSQEIVDIIVKFVPDFAREQQFKLSDYAEHEGREFMWGTNSLSLVGLTFEYPTPGVTPIHVPTSAALPIPDPVPATTLTRSLELPNDISSPTKRPRNW